MSDQNNDLSNRVRLRDLKILSDNHYTLRKASFDFQRHDGQWQHQERESYDIGDAAAVLPSRVPRARSGASFSKLASLAKKS
jgi:hypothetical protein